ncbi:MAG: PAS domain S-box protein [Gammaproteobacteria bacterium]|jgi:PAS domain S-box-containing protein
MKVADKTNEQLLKDLATAEARIAELESQREQAEGTLRQLKENTDRYLDLAEVILVALDDKANITMLGGRCYEILGYQSDELIGKNWFKVCLPEEEYDHVYGVFKNIMVGQQENVEYYENDILTKYGYKLHIAWHNSLLTDSDGRVIGTLSAGIDITERKQAEEILRQKEAQFRNIIDASPVPYALNDERQNIIYLNPAFINSFGYTLKDIPTLSHWWQKAYPDPVYADWVSASWQDRMDKVGNGGGGFEPLEVNIHCKDGAQRTVLASAAPLGDAFKGNHLVILYDITERKKMEHSLASSEERFRAMVENVPGVSYRCQCDEHCTMHFISTQIAQLSGYPYTDFINNNVRSYASLIHPEDRERVRKEVYASVKAKQALTIEYRILHANGDVKWVFEKGQGIYDPDGNVMSVDGVILDITDHKRAERALLESERKYRQLFENMTSGFALHEIICDTKGDPVNYRYLELNPAFTKLTGVPAEALLGKTILEVLPDTEKYWIDIFGKVALTGESIAYENYSRELGKYFDTWVFSPQKNQFAVIFTDVTERKKAEGALKEGDKHFRALFDQSSFGVAKIDSQTGSFLKINQRYCDLVGYSPAEMMQLNFQKITLPDDLDRDLKNMDRLRSGEISRFQVEKRYRHKNGSIVWVNLSVLPLWGKGDPPDFHLAIVEDITERKLAVENLQRQKDEQQQIINTMVDAVITIDQQGLIQTFSQSAESMFGYNASDVINKNIKALMPDDYAENHDDYIASYLETGEAHIIGYPREVAGRRKSGEVFPLRLSVAELPRTRDNKRRFIGSCQDVTAFKQQEEQLRRSQKMDALGKLTGGIAHDYNNLLGIILGYSELLHEALARDPELEKYAAEIHHASERGSKLSRKLLAFSRYKQPEADVVNINTLITAEKDLLQKTLTPSIRLELDLCDGIWPVYVDSSDLEDAILNLVINAYHAMKPGGSLTITSQNVHIGRRDNLTRKLTTGDYVKLSFADTGCGMDKEVQNKIFDPFFTTKGDDGVGLGLSMVYGFVTRSGGDIVINSTPDQGSKFYLYFPRYTQSIPAEPVKKVLSDNALEGKETILVVDDEAALVDLANKTLSRKGYNVLMADNAKQALSILRNNSIDLLLSDVVMPDMDGYQLAAIVQQQFPDIKIQLMSGYAENIYHEYVNFELEKRLLRKPFAAQVLLRRIREMLDDKPVEHSLDKPTIMVMDDEDSIRELFRINLNKLGYEPVLVDNGEQAVKMYQEAMQRNASFDAVILDLSMPGSISGQEVAQKILAIDSRAKLIVSSGDSYGKVMTNYEHYGFKGAVEKDFDRAKLGNVISQVLSSDGQA